MGTFTSSIGSNWSNKTWSGQQQVDVYVCTRGSKSQGGRGPAYEGGLLHGSVGCIHLWVVICVSASIQAVLSSYRLWRHHTEVDDSAASIVEPVSGAKVIKVDFTADVHSTMPWKFKPTQREVRVLPGETALAFYTVRNPTPKGITGVATYNVYPPKAGLYFNKIQCFCFEEQRLGGREEIDMPVFFYIDPEIVDDPAMQNVQNITLSYTFFKTGQEDDEEEEGETVQLQKQ